ncbi:hypothetical protein PMAYCL1PPCAC_28868, partial [Pristionchus mayeri]
LQELLKNAHSLLENVHPLLDLNKPTLSSIIPIGGAAVPNKNSPLSKEERGVYESIISIMEEEKVKGKKIVLVSFGTVMDPKTMKEETKKNLMSAFESVDEAVFFWKVNSSRFFSSDFLPPVNVKNYSWLPQNSLLASGKVDLFISHMGIGSMTEAAYSGVSLVSIPIFVDQHYNYVCARRLVSPYFV